MQDVQENAKKILFRLYIRCYIIQWSENDLCMMLDDDMRPEEGWFLFIQFATAVPCRFTLLCDELRKNRRRQGSKTTYCKQGVLVRGRILCMYTWF